LADYSYADDIMLEPELVLKYSRIIGLDAEKSKFSWDPARKEGLDEMWDVERWMLSTISSSAGIVKGKTSVGLDIDEEAKKWKMETEKWVRDAMLDYEYMRAKILRP
jgi:hypothetical protein